MLNENSHGLEQSQLFLVVVTLLSATTSHRRWSRGREALKGRLKQEIKCILVRTQPPSWRPEASSSTLLNHKPLIQIVDCWRLQFYA